jgi:amino acid adenylation domain-containing protein
MIHELFEQQAERSPDAIALVFEDSKLTYRELNDRSDRLARKLRGMGVGPDVLVALFLPRSPDMVVAMLGVLKAGGAYIPLDPTHPGNRVAWVLEDAKPLLVLTHPQSQPNLPPHPSRVVTMDGLCIPAELEVESPPPEPRPSSPSNLAYVIYTSGSTGKPKGVEIEHRAVINFLGSMQRRPGIDPTDTVLAITTLAFDIAVLEIFLPLVSGASIVIASTEATRDGGALGELMTRCGVTVLQATPSTLRMLLDAGWTGAPGLKILCGGEAWTAELADPILTRCGSLWNMYGPTETTVWSAVAKVEAGRPVAIGMPVANTRLYVLDRALQLVPIGVPGELYIGGKGLARGYLNQPELTRERFLNDPYAPEPGAKMYRTGDSVRRAADGTIEFLGRLDHQVKIRGHRVELGEIESALARHPGVTQCAVTASEDPGGERSLVAYFVPASGAVISAGELRLFLSEAVPTYMIPSAFVPLPSLPLTPNGKLDRKALPSANVAKFTAEAGSIEPRNPVEKDIARLWCEMLGLTRIGIRDNFFDLGGSSVLAARLIGRLNQRLGAHLGAAAIFQAPTVEGLSTLAKQSLRTTKDGPKVISLQSGHNGLPLYFMGAGPVEHRIAQLIGGDRNIFAVDVPIPAEWRLAIKSMDRAALPSFERLGALYGEALRAHIGSSPCIVVGYSFGGKIAFEAVRAAQRAKGNIALVLLIDAYAWSGLTSGTASRILRSIWRGEIKDAPYFGRVGASLNGSARLLWWLLAQAPRVLKSRLRKNQRPTSMLDSEAMPIEQSVLDDLNRIIGKSYNPQPLDASGVLIRAELPDERMLPDVDLTNGWHGLFATGLEVVQAKGNHWSIVSQDHDAAVLGLQIKAVLDRHDLNGKKPIIESPSMAVGSADRRGIFEAGLK